MSAGSRERRGSLVPSLLDSWRPMVESQLHGFKLASAALGELPHSRSGSLLNFALRTAFLPAFLVLEIAVLPWRIAKAETLDYQILTGGRRPDRGLGSVKIFVERLSACWSSSLALLFQATAYIVALDLIAALGLQHVIRNFRSEIEAFVALLRGAYYETVDGRRYPGSPSCSDMTFSLCGGSHSLGAHSSLCPHSSDAAAPADCPCRASFFAACSKLSYELEPVIEDVIENRWGLQLVGYGNLPADLHKGRDYVPDVVWFAAASSSGIVVAFTGAQLSNKVDRGTDIPCAMSEYQGCGRMTDGYVRGLDQKQPCGRTVFEELESLLSAHATSREVYVTGHSLGGALAVIFTQLLAVRGSKAAERIAGVYTYGAPRLGDRAFVNALKQRFEGRLFRYVNASDMICKLPHAFLGVPFEHHCGHRFIASVAPAGRCHRVLREEDDVKLVSQLQQREERLAHFYNLMKLVHPPAQVRGAGLAARLLLLLLPSVADHFPAEYQDALDEVLRAPPCRGRRASITVATH